MLNGIIAAAVGAVAIVLGVVINQSVLDGQTTTTWSTGTIAITFLLPLVLAAAGIIGILKVMGSL